MFLVALFLLKNGLVFKNWNDIKGGRGELAYSNMTIGDLVNKDTDDDGIPDWEEKLWGTDPTKKETTPGISDSVAINKLKAEQKATASTNGAGQTPEKLTKTDQFSRDLFTTIAAATQNGQPLDQATVDKISSSLAEHIQNSPPKKVFTQADLKIINDDSFQAIQKYNYALRDIYTKYPLNGDVTAIFKEFASDANTANTGALLKLNPIIERIQTRLNALVKIGVPQSLASLYLNFLNANERLSENLSDIKLFDTDAIVTLGAIIQYDQNAAALVIAANNLTNAIKQKWQN